MYYPDDVEPGGPGDGHAAELAGQVCTGGQEFRYSIKEIVDTFNLSRTSLLYYEKLGIVTPSRTDEASYRVYDEMDVFRLMSAGLLRNVGIPPRDLAEYLDRPYSHDRVHAYLRWAERRVMYDEALADCLRTISHVVDNVGAIEQVDVEPYYICWDNAEHGYHGFPPSRNLKILINHVPLGSFGSFGDDPYVVEEPSIKWGRTVSVRNATLLPGLDVNMDIIGGYHCVCFVHFEPDLYAMTRAQDFATHDRLRIREYMAKRGLHQVGSAFWPFTLPSGKGFIVPTCIPVGPLGMAADGAEAPEATDRLHRRLR